MIERPILIKTHGIETKFHTTGFEPADFLFSGKRPFVIEIKNAGINKGRAAQFRMGDQKFDFILAIGDDWTDEFTFDAMPDEAITLKVGNKPTRAKYYIDNYLNVREFLGSLIED
ncbi:MAG: hypothetical protein KAQ92_06730 [Candidatus Aenigmarchaeota archaeon]|nr:hypothetical protein [Candidatus Aenigmarchaeota archaeon]